LNFGYFCSHDHASHDHGNHEHEPFSESSKLMTSHDHDHDHANDSHGHSHSPTSSSGGYGSFTHVDSPTKKLHKEHSLPAIEEYSTATEPSDVNIQAAYLHVMTDLIQSVGVALAGLLIWYKPEWQIIDPICTFLFSGLVIWSTFSLLGRVVSILFEGVPAHVSTVIIIFFVPPIQFAHKCDHD
jgi:zinc transporter 2